MRTLIITQLLLAGALAATSQAVTFDANTAFAASQSANSTNSTFGNFTVGYLDSASNTFTPFTAATRDENFFGAPGVDGFWIHNNAVVPVAAVNTSAAAATLPYSGTQLVPNQILLHPGGLGSNAFDVPYYDAVLRFVVPATGFYNFTGVFSSLHSGQTLNGIYLDNIAFGTNIDAGTITGGANLTAGSIIDFRVGAGSDGIGSDSTGLFASISAPGISSLSVPDGGGTAMLLGLGIFSMLGVSKIRKGRTGTA